MKKNTHTATSTKALERKAFETLKGEFKLTNPFQAPRLIKVVVSVGTGSVKDKRKIEIIADRIARITGQKPAIRIAKQSIASFKLRQGEAVGYQITLRGNRMYQFVDKLIHIALPRTKDFRGISPKAVDDMGNYTLGIKENTIFPETSDEELKDVFGMAITFVTSSPDRNMTVPFLTLLGMPFKKA